jgi:hypothetical protein
MRQNFPVLLFLLLCSSAFGQTYKVSGKVVNRQLEPLAFASIEIKEFKYGTTSKEDGTYELQLEEGKYDVVVSMIGYKATLVTLVVNKNTGQNFILEPDDSKALTEVVVKGKIKDRAEEIIRNVIRNKEAIQAAAGAYSCTVYIRATQEDSLALKGRKIKMDTSQAAMQQRELEKMAMAEISLRYDHASLQQTKEERLGVSKRGNAQDLFYLSATEGDFSLYNNLIKIPSLSTIPFISPVSYSGLLAYRFKTLKIEQRGNQKIYTISIRPRQLSNATVEGEVIIADSSWVILRAGFHFPSYHLPEYDFFEVHQQYDLVNDTAWMITRQSFTYFSKMSKGKRSGRTVAFYRDFVFNRQFPKGYFGNEVSVTAQEAYEKDSSFWQQTRTEPLTDKELRFIRYKDSVYSATHTKAYLDSIDARINKVTWKKILYQGQTLHDHEKERTWVLPTVFTLYQPFQFGGTRISPTAFYSRIFPSRKNISVFLNLSYGLRNHDVNGSFNVSRMYNPFNRGFYSISGGRQFQYIYSGDAWINMLKRSNIYLNNAIGIGHGLELFNGLFLYSDIDIAFRRSVSNYKTNSQVDSLFGDILEDNRAIAFEPYNAVYGKIRLQYTPGQRYIREPKEKIILGSRWPTFYTLWRKGIPGLLNSKVNFDYLEFGIEQRLRLGTAGMSSYTIKTGNFLNQKDLRLVDYKFQRRGDPLLFMNPNEAFQSLDSTFAVFRRFYEGHYVHEFNGLLINKVPFLKKLQLREVAGAGFLIAQERSLRYAEVFAGVERVFKWPFSPMAKFKLGVYVVGSAANQFKNPVQFKIGLTTWDRQRNRWF